MTLSLVERARRRALFIDTLRAFFKDQGFIEVDTPILLSAPAPEPQLEAPAVELSVGNRRQRRYLQTSPELPMKRLLAAGLAPIFQIAATFRDGELGAVHRPEFRMLEWYRLHAGYEALLEDCEGLLTRLDGAKGTDAWTVGGRSFRVERPFRRLSVDDAFVQHAGFSILEALNVEQLGAELDRLGIHRLANDSWDDLFHRIFLSRVEPALCADPRPLFLTHYPAPLCALARLSPTDPRVAERFELYVGGIEVANGYSELCDPIEQRRRFEHDRQLRRSLGRHDYPLDEHFLSSLGSIGSAAGIALGVDRLLMLLLGENQGVGQGAPDLDGAALIPWLTA